MQVFAYSPGRIYEVWTAPLRVTALTLAPGERIVAIAAGDTVRWQIGQTTSGGGGAERAHVMIKPMERGLETNLVLTTSARVYLLQLKSGAPETSNAAVAWDVGEVAPPPILANVQGRAQGGTKVQGAKPGGLVSPAGPLDARYKIQTGRRAPIWAPTMIMTDGVRTFLRFPDALAAHEAPALFMLGPDGEPQLLNYRQQGGLWIVDRVLDQAELRLGAGRSEVVKIVRVGDRS
ncbi:MAG TPA: TrbG/VirB9 family P-type conjugative transfer protein [Phenylobacterium sp.]|uniref:TrbG/VirB9 family P-type conjugative transfer protein n=1 Tax=Phenylobacterium sp. TaxID=1871053 RepID=UPI002F920268